MPGAIASSVRIGVRCADEFREDEELLRTGAPAVRVVTLADVAVSYGVGVRSDAPYLGRARAAGVAVARRSSGGSGVLHGPGDLAWSVVLPRRDPRVGRDFVHGYGRFGAGAVRFLERFEIPAHWAPAPGVSEGFCVLSRRGRVLSADGRVLGGAAQHVTRDALLHQGMIPLSVDRGRVSDLFELAPSLVAERLVGLEDLGIVTSSKELAARLAVDLSDALEEAPG
jgi:lipoate-protein ligase A